MNEPPREPELIPLAHLRQDPSADHVVDDSPCQQCGYNLRTLAMDSLCPECGTSVQYSIRSYFLRFADPGWVRNLAIGLLLLLISIGAMVVVIPAVSIGIALPRMLELPQSGLVPSDFFGPLMITRFVLNGLVGLVALAGLVLLTRRDPGQRDHPEGFTARRAIRLSCVLLPLLFIGNLVLALNTPLAAFTPGSNPAAVFGPAFAAFVTLSVIVGVASAVVVSFVTLALLRHVASLMRRIPRPGLVRFARIEFWGLMVCTVLLSGAYAVLFATLVPMVSRMAATMGPATASAPFTVTATPAAVPVPISVMNIGGGRAAGTTQPTSTPTTLYEVVVPGGNVAIATTNNPASLPAVATATMPVAPAIPAPTAGFVGGMFLGACVGVPAVCGTGGFTVAGLILFIIACKALFDAAREAQQNRALQ